jgi:pSer/pThr/pTyr-binding forkhead associated (FHA) protein
MPGLLERLRSLRDCTIQVLPPAAAAWGALQYESSIRRAPDSLALVYQLPVPRAETGDVQSSDVEATPPQLRPTHVLFQGRAWSITDQPLTIGWAVEDRKRALALPSALPGISRAHCTVVRRNGAVIVEDHSTYGSFVNDEKVSGRTALTVGDRLRLGSPGVTLELIQLVNDHGTPQD